MNRENFLIAFSIGNLWPWNSSPNRNCLINYIYNLDIEGVELCFATREQLMSFKLSTQNRKWLKGLKWVSIHAPFNSVTGSSDSKDIQVQLDRLSEIYSEVNARNIIFHPGQLPARDLLSGYDFTYSLENLPPNHGFSVTKLKQIMNEHPEMGLCLDVGHAYMYSKNEIRLLVNEFRSRIRQVHFHAVYRGTDHLQFENPSISYMRAIRPVFDLDCTIVIEENFFQVDMDQVKREILNVKNMFRKSQAIKKSVFINTDYDTFKENII